MPEQQSHRSAAITTAEITAPFQTEILPFGLGGLNLKDQADQIPLSEFPIHTNLIHSKDRGVSPRPGLTSYATGGTNHHTVRRLSDPQNSTYTRIWGTDQDLRIGQSGALSSIDSGYSGDPLVLLPHRPPLSGDPWMFVADRSRMRKVRFDGLDLPIGLPEPSAAPTIALGTRNLTSIANFTGDTDPALWTPNKGTTYDEPPAETDLPEILDITCPDPNSTEAIHFGRIASTDRPTGDFVFFGVSAIRDLSKVGVKDATDDDYIHLWLNFSHPQFIEEFRLYLVCAASFSPTVLPGIPDGFGSNTDAYVKTFSANDFANFFQAQASQVSAAEAARVHAVRDQSLQSAGSGRLAVIDAEIARMAQFPVAVKALSKIRARMAAYLAAHPSIAVAQAQQDAARAQTIAGPGGADQWHEMGVVSVPLRRGDFQRMGETANRDWSTITGIVTMIKTSKSGAGPVAVRMGYLYMHGGEAIDSGEPGAQPYDYRVTNYDPRTGAEGNPSDEMVETNFLDTLRRSIVVDPPAYGDAAIRQRIYRRGGSLNDDWYFLGVNSADGGTFTDTFSDDSASTAGTVNLNHYEAVPTINDAGDTVLAQPVPVLFGPVQGLLFALGDPYRPGHLYWCIPDAPDHWAAENNLEVCSPSEELMAGLLYGSQPFCFSRERLYAIYPNLSGDTAVSVSPTACRRGLVSRKGWAVGFGGIYGVAKDGIFVTAGGGDELVSTQIQRLFRGETWQGYAPVNFAFPNAIQLSISQDLLYFQYQDTLGDRRVLMYSLVEKFWTSYEFAQDISYILSDDDTPIALTLVGGKTTGKSYTHTGFSDDGTAIPWVIRTKDWDLNRPREDKLLGDQILDADLQNATVTLQNRLNSGAVVNSVQTIDVGTGRQRFIFDSFGVVPQRARTISTELVGSSAIARPVFYFLGQSYMVEPDQTLNRVTQWDDLGHPDEKYLTGVTFDCDTGGTDRTILIEIDINGTIVTAATLTVNASGRHKIAFSWAAVQAHKVRIRPSDDCKAWILYRADWIALPEPPRIAGWDCHFENASDQYYTGLDLYGDTSGEEKQIEVYVDEVLLINPYTLEAFWRVTMDGRQLIHLTFLAGRGHVFHFVAIDAHPGVLYSHKWHLQEEPTEQSNFDANYSVQGTLADKWFKAFLFEVDTFDATKSVTIELDGVVVETLSVTTDGRKVVQLALSQQRLGRVLRVYPTDGNPGRPYSIVPIFDVEPYALTRWEDQESDDGIPGFKTWLFANVTLVSTADVTLTMTIQRRQEGNGAIQTRTYTLPSTGGVKLDLFVSFFADKGVKRKYLFTSASAFRLYREESSVIVQPWGAAESIVTRPFGNDDNSVPTRSMISSVGAAARSGGGST